jgi:hypothetical protein
MTHWSARTNYDALVGMWILRLYASAGLPVPDRW